MATERQTDATTEAYLFRRFLSCSCITAFCLELEQSAVTEVWRLYIWNERHESLASDLAHNLLYRDPENRQKYKQN